MTFEVKANKWTRELAQLAQWDPREPGNEPHVNYNTTKITHLTKRFLEEAGVKDKWEKEFGATLYDICKGHPNANKMALICGMVSVEDFKDITSKGIVGSSKLYSMFEEQPREFVTKTREICLGLTLLLEQPSEVDFGSLGKLELPDSASCTAINAVLTGSKLPPLEDIFRELSEFKGWLDSAHSEAKEAKAESKKLNTEVERLKSEVSNLMARSTSVESLEYTTERGEIPDGKVVMRKVKDIWHDVKLPTRLGNMEVPTWEWDGEHPDVPTVDEHYIFRPNHLQRALYAIVTNQREYIQGHTGSGKTTLVEQVAARLNWPFLRINFDSEITRMDLIGRDTLVSDSEGNVTSVFEDGMLPTAMSGPYICCFDELDFVRPDVAYVMQAALEGNGLRITEDGDRLVKPHPMFRMFGTGNTVGQGDEDGMYQGARPQSMAFLDRFTIWDKVDYLDSKQREELVMRKYPALGEKERKQVLQYTTEHLEAFTQGKVIQPISPRGILAICQATILLGDLKAALEMSVIDRANREDRATLKGLVDRVTK